jgi:hypothetical protein
MASSLAADLDLCWWAGDSSLGDWPALSLQAREIPPFECLTIIFLIAWLALRFLERPAAKLDSAAPSWTSWTPALAFALCESAASAFFLLATRYIAAAEANLITYLIWAATRFPFRMWESDSRFSALLHGPRIAFFGSLFRRRLQIWCGTEAFEEATANCWPSWHTEHLCAVRSC